MADTRVMVNDGETAVIGGLIRSNESVTERGVPVLMDIPLVGMLFKSSSKTKQKRELLIFLTPKILGETTASTN
jgi:type IV pilus assembly protein PilQ